MTRQVLVTGGAGFIGSALTKRLLEQRASITTFDNLSFGRRENVWPGVRLLCGDLRSKRDVLRVLDRNFDAVYHLAAVHFIPYCNSHPKEAVSINIDGTRVLLDALRKRPPKKLFFASTAAVYGPTSVSHLETEIPEPMDIYGITKLAGEALVRIFQAETGIPCAVGRLFNAYGPRETNAHLIPCIVEQLKQRRRLLQLGNLAPFRDYIHTTDMARAIVKVVERMRKGYALVNVASGNEYSVRQVVRIVLGELGRKVPIRSKTSLRRKIERRHLRPSLTRLRHFTGFKPEITFREGVRALLVEEGLLHR